MTNIDNAELLGCFVAEAAERVQKLNDGLLAVEKAGLDESVLEAMFREAHTLKGAAGMIGCGEISALAHGFEDVLSGLKADGVDLPQAIAVLFRCCDAIRDIVDELNGTTVRSVDVDDVLESLAGLRKPESNREPPAGSEQGPAPAPEPEGPPGDRAEETGADAENGATQATSKRVEETVRVAIDKLDSLANTVGEIVISRVKLAGNVDVLRRVSEVVRGQNRVIAEISGRIRNKAAAGVDSGLGELTTALNNYMAMNRELSDLTMAAYNEQHDAISRIETIIDQLDTNVSALRMRPISSVFEPFPRIVRDLAREYDKKVDLIVDGGETELDRTMLEGIKDPLMHLLRNAVDHGIETCEERGQIGKPPAGKIRLSARQDGDRVIITIEDDGRGIDAELVRVSATRRGLISRIDAERMSDAEVQKLIFTSGFSTKANVTDISGRGVGTDVVKKYVEDNLHGQVHLESVLNMGTRFTLVLPLTLAVTPSVLVKSGGRMFAIPAHSVQIGLRVNRRELRSIDEKLAVNVIDSTVPLVKLDETLSLPAPGEACDRDSEGVDSRDQIEIVVIEHGGRRLAFMIDELVEEQDIVVKRLEAPLDDLRFVAGVTILEKGEVIPILKVDEIIQAGRQAGSFFGEDAGKLTHVQDEPKRSVLIVEDSLTTRELMKNIIRSAGYNVEAACDGVEALEKLAGNKLDLIVTDIEMPRMNGFEMTRRIRSDPKLKDIPVIIVTSMMLDDERKRGLEAGADAYIRKGDFDQSRLVDTIKKLVV